MKKFAFFAIVALAFASCAKEVDTPQAPARVNTYTLTIKAGFDATKTAYDAQGKFSWVEGDKIGVVVSNGEQTKQVTLTAASAGPSVEFSGEVEEGFTPTGYASYPFTQVSEGYACNDLAYDAEKNGWRLWGSIKPSAEDPLSCIPLLGTADGDGYYTFKTAVGIVKFTVKNVPPKTAYAYLEVPSESVNTSNLNGWYSLSEDGSLLMENAVEPYNTRYNWNAPATFNTTMDFYYFIPAGTIPAGSKFELCNASWAALKSFEIKKDVEVVRNAVVEVAPIELDALDWTSLGTGKFIDSFVWAENALGTEPVDVEIFYHPGLDQYKMPNPYVIAATAAGKTAEGADEEFFFSIVEKGRVQYDRVEMGLSISNDPEKTWAMIDGETVASYGNDFSHVVYMNAAGEPQQIQLAPCYRTTDDSKEIGKDHQNGVIEIVFPEAKMLSQFVVSDIKVSANHTTDGAGAAGLIDNKLDTYWHTPWSDAYPSNPDATYGQYVDVTLPEYATTVAFNYCTRDAANQNGAPAMVVVGGSADGKTFTEIATFELDQMKNPVASTWVGLPAFDATGYAVLRFGIAKNKAGYDLRDITDPATQWCNLAELMVWGIGTGEPVEIAPAWLEDGQVWVKASQLTVNSDCSKYDGTGLFDGNGFASLVDGDASTYWHSCYVTGYTGYYDKNVDFDATYGITVDIALATALKDFHLSYKVRSDNNNGEPRAIILAGSNDGTAWTDIETFEDDALMKVAAGSRVNLPAVNATEAYSYLRIGIIKAGNGDTPSDLRVAGGGFTSLGEILLFAD